MDSMPLQEYLLSILNQMAEVSDRVTDKRPWVRVTFGEVRVRCVLKPGKNGVLADIDEAAHVPVSEIPITLTVVPKAQEQKP